MSLHLLLGTISNAILFFLIVSLLSLTLGSASPLKNLNNPSSQSIEKDPITTNTNLLQNETRTFQPSSSNLGSINPQKYVSSSASASMSISLEQSLITSSSSSPLMQSASASASPSLSPNPSTEKQEMKEEKKQQQETTQNQSPQHPNENFQNETENDDISLPKDIIRMIALPPRDLVPGSTKGMPYKVRILHTHRRRGDDDDDQSDNDGLLGESYSKSGLMQWVRRKLLSFESLARRQIYNVDLHGGIVGVGEYFSFIEIGGKSIRVQIDTGSSTLAVPMKGCNSCINKVNRYDVEQSLRGHAISCDSDECASDRCTTNCPVCSFRGACCSTKRPAECGFSLKYADGSAASGSVVHDEMHWGKLWVNVTFGGILKNSPNFERPEVDGILGMAFKSLACNPSCFDPPFDALVKTGLVEDIFSICMTSTGGKLMLGGFDKRVARSKVQYVKLTHSGAERYYRVTLDGKLGIGDEFVEIPDFHTAIVDTGTTLIVTSTRTFAAIKEQLQKKFCDVPELCHPDSWFQSGMCVNLSDQDLALMPTFSFNVGGDVRLTLRPEDYMLAYKRGRRQYRCVGIMGMDGLGGMVVLGNTLMQRYVTVYDRKGGRIGFALAAAKCGD